MAEDVPFTEEDLHDLYLWVDAAPISRPKKNIARDFSDGCCVAEIIHHHFPKLVELHNYPAAMSRSRKVNNWETLNARVLSKIHFTVSREEIEDLTAAVPGAIERFLRALRIKLNQIKAHQESLRSNPDKSVPESPFRTKESTSQPLGSSRPSTSTGALSGPKARENRRPEARPTGRRSGERPNSHRDPHEHEYTDRLLEERGKTIAELKETVAILSEKIMKLEELVQIKDQQLNHYRSKFGNIGGASLKRK